MPSNGTISLEGSCACGLTIWSSTSSPQHLDFCYCTTCQQISGAPFVAWMGITRDAITWSGAISSLRVCDFAVRTFCTGCGGTLSIQYDCYPRKTHVAAGMVTATKEGCEMPKVGCHLFVRSKPAWYQMSEDGVARYEEFDGEFLGVLEQWRASKS